MSATIPETFRNDSDLHHWLEHTLRLCLPHAAICPGHDAPFDYVASAFFEPARDLVVWAPRGGGKTRLAAIATLLDLLYKPGCQVRILGGSLDQSLRMWEYLNPALAKAAERMLRRERARYIDLTNGSAVAVLTQSQKAVRGLHVQKLRCDEVELFDPAIWEAAQLITRSSASETSMLDVQCSMFDVQSSERGATACSQAVLPSSQTSNSKSQISNQIGNRQLAIGNVEALSTLHAPFGLMQKILDNAAATHKRIIKWCILEVLENCPKDRDCKTCPLFEECKGIAKEKCHGFLKIDDAIAMKARVSRETWESEMLCRRPSVRHCVFPHFRTELHVKEPPSSLATSNQQLATSQPELWLAIDFGFASPFVCLWIQKHEDGRIHILDEYVQPSRTIEEHLQQIARRPWGKPHRIACDPAGAAQNEQTAQSNITALKKAGYQVRHNQSSIVDGLELIRSALFNGEGKSKLTIHPRCTRLIRAMQAHHYAEGGSELPVKDGDHDHLIDALRYYFANANRSSKVTVRYY